jgi:hypothetical protein
MNKESSIKKAKHDLSKVKCFNYNNHGHLAKDCPKSQRVIECIAQSKLIILGDLVAKIWHTKASKLLKLNYKINDKVVGCLLHSRTTNLLMTIQVVKRLGVKIE